MRMSTNRQDGGSSSPPINPFPTDRPPTGGGGGFGSVDPFTPGGGGGVQNGGGFNSGIPSTRNFTDLFNQRRQRAMRINGWGNLPTQPSAVQTNRIPPQTNRIPQLDRIPSVGSAGMGQELFDSQGPKGGLAGGFGATRPPVMTGSALGGDIMGKIQQLLQMNPQLVMQLLGPHLFSGNMG